MMTVSPPIAVDVAVVLTAIVCPEPDAGGFSASIPALPGCHTQGNTMDEVRANLREAAEGWLAVAHDEGVARDTAGIPAGKRGRSLRQGSLGKGEVM